MGNFVLTMLGFFPGIIHAMAVVRQYQDEQHHRDQIKYLRRGNDLLLAQAETLQVNTATTLAANGGQVPRHLLKRKPR
jgi:hypothetical protein